MKDTRIKKIIRSVLKRKLKKPDFQTKDAYNYELDQRVKIAMFEFEKLDVEEKIKFIEEAKSFINLTKN